MEQEFEGIEEVLSQARKDLDRKAEKLQEQDENLKAMEALLAYTRKMAAAYEQAKTERDELREEMKTLRMQNEEMKKVANKVAEKTEHDDLQKVFRTYLNRSKQKTAKKRGYIRMVIMEMAMAANLELPEDVVATLESFDDEPKDEGLTLNVYEKDSCKFGAGSSQNGDVKYGTDN